MITIKVLGSGCANCKRLEQVAHKVVSDMGIEAEIIKVTEYPRRHCHRLQHNPEACGTSRLPSPPSCAYHQNRRSLLRHPHLFFGTVAVLILKKATR